MTPDQAVMTAVGIARRQGCTCHVEAIVCDLHGGALRVHLRHHVRCAGLELQRRLAARRWN